MTLFEAVTAIVALIIVVIITAIHIVIHTVTLENQKKKGDDIEEDIHSPYQDFHLEMILMEEIITTNTFLLFYFLFIIKFRISSFRNRNKIFLSVLNYFLVFYLFITFFYFIAFLILHNYQI